MKKIIVFFIVSFLFILSCGKKGDPEFKAEKIFNKFDKNKNL